MEPNAEVRMSTLLSRWWMPAFAGLVLVGVAHAAEPAAGPVQASPAAAQAPTARATGVADEPATLRLLNRDVVTFRASLPSASPAERVERARQRFRELPKSEIDQPLRTIPFEYQGIRGVQLTRGAYELFVLIEGDVDVERGETLDGLTQAVLARLEEVRAAWHRTNDLPLLLLGLARAAAGTVVLGVLLWLLGRATRRAVAWMEAARDRIAARNPGVDWRELLARLALGTTQLVRWLPMLFGGYVWLRLVLGSFVATQPLAEALDKWLRARLDWVVDGIVGAVPGIVTVIIVFALTRALVDVLGYFFDAVQRGRLQLPLLHPETTMATRRIVAIVVWGLGIAIAYPYLPGSSTDAFKGLSVLFGVMVTLGSAGIVTQAMSGLVLVYSRALRRGDFVGVNGVQGVVTEVSSLAVKVVTERNEEVTIPNSVLVSSAIHNFSRLADSLVTTSVTIGYDTPWRQVHALLIDAARRTPGLRRDFEPYVYQRALSDFYVEYELFVGIEPNARRAPVMSALHAAIQDGFNEHGVQIMSPHFEAQPDRAVVVPKGDWYQAPAAPPT
jgi:small-conductance mechanosensitive channel